MIAMDNMNFKSNMMRMKSIINRGVITMNLNNNLKSEIIEQFNEDWSNYCTYNDINSEDNESKDIFKEEWLSNHEEYLDAIIEDVDSLEYIEYITDPLDYEKYQEAQQIFNNFVYEEL